MVSPEAHYQIGQSFQVQFAWHLPHGDYLRAVFTAVVLDLIPQADKYLIRLSELVAGRQEDSQGRPQPQGDYSPEYWALVGKLIDRKLTIAYEADDGQAIHLRLSTLTGEHNFFTRYEDTEVITKGLQAAVRRKTASEEE